MNKKKSNITLFSLIKNSNISEEDKFRLNKDLEDLCKDSEQLGCLEAHGVDKWDGYELAMKDFEG